MAHRYALEGEVLPTIDSALETILLCRSEQGKLQQEHFDRMTPFRLQIECSTECSADCAYCYARAVASSEPLSTREMKGLLRRAAGMGVKHVDWMGGDPLERPDWIELMQAARYAGLTNNIWTCGPLLNDVVNAKRVIELTKGGFVMVHLDSLDPDVLQSLRATYNPKTTRDTLRGVRLLQDMGKAPEEIGNLIMMTSQHTVEDVKETMSALYREFGLRTCLMSLKPVDDAGRLYGLLPRADDVNAAYAARDDMFMEGRRMGCQDFPKQYCGSTIFISLDGKVSSCYSLRRPLGSVREQTFEDIVSSNASSLFFTQFRTSNQGLCAPCDKATCWGCRANAFYFGRGVYSPDPLCELTGSPPVSNYCPY